MGVRHQNYADIITNQLIEKLYFLYQQSYLEE